MAVAVAAWVFCVAAAATILLHTGLALGAPWGHMTMGGQVTGRLPAPMRVLSVAQGALLGWFICVILARAGLWPLAPLVPSGGWGIWIVFAVCILSVVANSITSSRAERAFGVPMMVAMSLGSLTVAILTKGGT